MSSDNPGVGSVSLEILAQKLRLYKASSRPQPKSPEIGKHLISNELDSASKSATSHVPSVQSTKIHKRAAVLICLFQGKGGDLRVILTKRSSNLSSHSGEVALPGGKREENDADDVETALREAHEEIGLDPSLVDVVAILDPFMAKNGMTVVPVIGILYEKESFNPAPNAAEVEAIFDAPLEMFLKDEKRSAAERETMGYKYLLHFFEYEAENGNYVIWALTAGILIKAASIVYQREPAFAELRPKFWSSY